jgi:stearoyl-CoA desaturase (Delta-9 desaturase)
MNFQKEINWKSLLFMTAYHACLFVLLPAYLYYYGAPGGIIIIFSTILFIAIGLGITTGYHRLFSHKSYKAHPVMKALLLFFGSLAAENSAIEWSYNHRIHHAKTDTPEDPYSIKKGFLYAHLLCIFKKTSVDKTKVPDLASDRPVMLQDRFYTPLYLAGNAFFTLIIGFLAQDYFGAFVFSYLLRTFVVHHMTFLINSAAHMWISRTYNPHISAADNWFLSFFSFGEGYHNYHHAYPADYRNGVRWHNFDPTKWLVYSLSKVGITRDLIKLT